MHSFSDRQSEEYAKLKEIDPSNSYPSDRGHFNKDLSDELIEVLVKIGSCQPKKMIKTKDGQMFNPEAYYHRRVYSKLICFCFNKHCVHSYLFFGSRFSCHLSQSLHVDDNIFLEITEIY